MILLRSRPPMFRPMRAALAALLLATALEVAAFTIAAGPAAAAEAEMHYAPVENLEHIDLALIKSAKKSVDVAMYTLTDWPIIAALKDALAHGVAVRIALDPSVRQAYDKLADMADVVRVKKRGPLMHLKAYAIDGALLRTGSANLSPGGLKQQDNDLVILHDPAATAKFEARFAEIYAAAEPMRVEPPPACPVKGNVNRKGERIYHMPGGRDYDRVAMENCDASGACAHGKRWFCSAAEAEQAGWRQAH